MAYYVTFYSYKGGVGRTTALVNTAVLLAREASVLIWELDLEAPGLLSIPMMEPLAKIAKGGTIDVLANPPKSEADWGDALSPFVLEHPGFDGGRLRVLPAGKAGAGYPGLFEKARVNLDRWFAPDSTDGSVAFELLRRGLEPFHPAYVLIDSRTGLTDVGGICTVQLADHVVLVYNLGHQNLDGTRQVLRAIGDEARMKEIRGPNRETLKITRVASMVPPEWPELAAGRRAAAESELVRRGRQKAAALDAFHLKPDVEVPLHTALLLEETIWAHAFPDDPLTGEYGKIARRIEEAAPKPVMLRVEIGDSLELRDDIRVVVSSRGREFEERVARTLRLMGFEVTTDVTIAGRQTDFLARRKDPFQEICYVGECKDHAKAASADDLDALHGRVTAYKRENPAAQGLLVARHDFTAAVKTQARALNISLRTYGELLDGLADLGGYPAGLIADVEGRDIERMYVEPDVFPESEGKLMALDAYVAQWLADPNAVHLTLLGDYGTGKTWFTRRLAWQLARKYREDPSRNPCPIRIDLRSAARAISLENVIDEHLRGKTPRPVAADAILHLLEEGRYVLIFDGFDEMATQAFWDVTVRSFRELLRAARGKAKVLLTCRTHFFRTQDEVREAIEGKASKLSAEGTELYKEVFGKRGFSVAYLRDFTEAQVRAYLEKAGATGVAGLLSEVRGLEEIASRPVLLDMIVRSAPRLKDRTEIKLGTLYEAYTEEWLSRADGRSVLDREGRRTMAQELARRLWETDGARLHHTELRQAVVEILPEKARNLAEVDVLDQEVRTASFFTRDGDGNYGFSHRSFLEFFLAQWVARGLDREPVERLRLRRLSPEVVGFLGDLCERGRLEAAVGAVLGSGYVAGASENALGLYARLGLGKPGRLELAGAELVGAGLAGVDLGGADLRGARMAGVDLVGAVLEGADLRGADLPDAKLDEVRAGAANFREARLVGAEMVGADFRGARFDGADLRWSLGVGARWDAGAPRQLGMAVEAGSRLEPVVQGFAGGVSAAYDPSGTWIAAAAGPEILILDAETLRVRLRLRGHSGWVQSVGWSPDGTRLASGSDDATVRVWDPASGNELLRLAGHSGGISGVTWSPDSAGLASGGSLDYSVWVWDLPTGKGELLLRGHLKEGHMRAVDGVAWNPCTSRLALGLPLDTVVVISLPNGIEVARLKGHRADVNCTDWSPDGVRLACGSGDTVLVWNTTSEDEPQHLEGHTDSIASVEWNPGGTLLASGSYDKTVRVWEAGSGQQLRLLAGHTSFVRSVVWSPDGTRLASGSHDNTVRVWEAGSGQQLRLLAGHTSGLRSVVWSPDGTRLASGSSDNTVRVWEAGSGQQLRLLEGHTNGVRMGWSPDGTRLAFGSWDNTVQVWEAGSGQQLRLLAGHTGGVLSVVWSPGGSRLASGSDDNTVRVWEASSGRQLRLLEGHTSGVLTVGWSPDGTRLASGSWESTVRVWEADTGKQLRLLEGHTDGVLSVGWSPDGSRLASGSGDKTVRVWEASSGREQRRLEGHTESVFSVVWSPDGSRLASGSEDNTVRVWEASSGVELLTLDAGTPVTAVDWRGGSIAASTVDGRILVWDAETGDLIQTMYGFDDGGWLTVWADNTYDGDERGLSRLMFGDGSGALFPARVFPEWRRAIPRG